MPELNDPQDEWHLANSAPEEALHAARREAEARSEGVRKRYMLASREVVTVKARERKRRNLMRNTQVRILALAIVGLGSAILVPMRYPNEVSTLVQRAQDRTSRLAAWIVDLKNGTQIAGSEKVPAKTPESKSETQTVLMAQRPASLEALRPLASPHLPATERPDEAAQAPSTPDDPVVEDTPASGPVSSAKPVVLMPTPIPGAPLSTLKALKDGVATALPAERATSPQPTVGIRAPTDDGASVARPTQIRTPAEPAIDQDLVAAVNAARTRLDPATTLKQPTRPSTGVFVELPKRQPGNPQAEPKSPQNPTSPHGAHKEETKFAVVSAFEGGLLVRTGRNVTPIRIGEALPDGRKLATVNAGTGGFTTAE